MSLFFVVGTSKYTLSLIENRVRPEPYYIYHQGLTIMARPLASKDKRCGPYRHGMPLRPLLRLQSMFQFSDVLPRVL